MAVNKKVACKRWEMGSGQSQRLQGRAYHVHWYGIGLVAKEQ
ncbi:hypothetical protein [Chryseolinea sp. H1M3-3]|nr:hypothetical protein [Chryseolinea sp. H1M3-3]